MVSSPSIPEDIIFELFSWLPVKSLMRFKSVSKFCNTLVFESDFMDIHQSRTMIRPGGTRLFVRENHEKGSFYTIERNAADVNPSLVHIEDFDGLYSHVSSSGTCLECVNGLFCLWRKYRQPAVICNPSTRQVKFLPYLNVGNVPFHCSLGFDPQDNIYKVLFMTLVKIQNRFYTRIYIHTLGIDESWKEINSIPHYVRLEDGVCINGVIYMFNRSGLKKKIVAFDVKTENFITISSSITLWEAPRYNDEYYNLMEVDGKLAVLENRLINGEIDLWIFGMGQHEGWEKHIILGFPLVHEEVDFRSQTYYDGEIIILAAVKCDKLSYFCYDITRKSWRECQVEGFRGKDTVKAIFKCVESLFPIGKRRPIDKYKLNGWRLLISFVFLALLFIYLFL